MSSGIIETIKKVALEIIREREVQVLFGKVKSVEPLVITISNLRELTQEFIVLNSPVDAGEEVVLIKYATGNKYLVLSTVEKVHQGSIYTGGTLDYDTNDGTWTTCNASAYGDGDIGNLMANGERLTANSMTVAVPMGSYYKKHKNKRMMICYNGKVVTVRVTDCGNFGAGNKYTNRQLDLAPGVWKEFGAKSTRDWGIKKVQYKFVDK